MSLTLTIANVDRLENGEPARMQLDRHGLTIGRSPHTDWSLPDPQHYISSSHCEVRYRDGAYTLVDTSTNGTYLKGQAERLAGPHVLKDGDVIVIGHYELQAKLLSGVGAAGAGASTPAPQEAFAWGATTPSPAPAQSAWDAPASPPSSAPPASTWESAPDASPGWGAAPGAASAGWGSLATDASASAWGAPAASPPAADAWGAPTPAQAPSPAPSAAAPSWGAPASAPLPEEAAGLSGHWAAPSLQPAPPPPVAASPLAVWDAPAAPVQPASAWSDPAGAAPRPAAAGDIWASLADVNTVDWDRGGFDRPTPKPAPPPLTPAPAAASWSAPAWPEAAPQAAAPSPPPPQAAPIDSPPVSLNTPAGVAGDDGWTAFLKAAGVAPVQIKGAPAQALAAAGGALKRLVGGMVVLMEARARAKAQMGAQGTMLEFSGNNPLKFARAPEQAMAQLLNPAERGFMATDLAIEDAFRDLQAHQMATLAAMQGALRATVTRFSPGSIRSRAETRGVLAKILPAARDQAMWQAYEREFEGVARGSDEAFMDVFAKEFRQAYEQAAAKLKPPAV